MVVGSVLTVAAPNPLSPVKIVGKGNALAGICVLWKLQKGQPSDLDKVGIALTDSVIGSFRKLAVLDIGEVPRSNAFDGAALDAYRERWAPAGTSLSFAKDLGCEYIVNDRPADLTDFALSAEWAGFGFSPGGSRDQPLRR